MKLNKDDSIKGLQGIKETNAIRINIETMNKRISYEKSGKPIGETNCYLLFSQGSTLSYLLVVWNDFLTLDLVMLFM